MGANGAKDVLFDNGTSKGFTSTGNLFVTNHNTTTASGNKLRDIATTKKDNFLEVHSELPKWKDPISYLTTDTVYCSAANLLNK